MTRCGVSRRACPGVILSEQENGTGACAAAAASYRMGLTDRTVFVEMPGGTLLVETKEDLTMYLTGSARAVGTFFVAEHFFA